MCFGNRELPLLGRESLIRIYQEGGGQVDRSLVQPVEAGGAIRSFLGGPSVSPSLRAAERLEAAWSCR